MAELPFKQLDEPRQDGRLERRPLIPAAIDTLSSRGIVIVVVKLRATPEPDGDMELGADRGYAGHRHALVLCVS